MSYSIHQLSFRKHFLDAFRIKRFMTFTFVTEPNKHRNKPNTLFIPTSMARELLLVDEQLRIVVKSRSDDLGRARTASSASPRSRLRERLEANCSPPRGMYLCLPLPTADLIRMYFVLGLDRLDRPVSTQHLHHYLGFELRCEPTPFVPISLALLVAWDRL